MWASIFPQVYSVLHGGESTWNVGEVTWSKEVYRLMEHDPSLPVINYAKQSEIMEPDSLRRLQAAAGLSCKVPEAT